MLSPMYTTQGIQEGVKKLSGLINLKVNNPCIWIVLRGGFVFGADLIRELRGVRRVKFLDIQRGYEADTTHLPPREWHRPDDPPIFSTKYTHVLVDVVCETGATFDFITEHLVAPRQRTDIVKVVLVVKGQPKTMPTYWHFWYRGAMFLTGYGMGPYRYLPYIAEQIRR